MTEQVTELDERELPDGIRSRFIDQVNGLRMHILETGFETPGRPCLLLLHGFPELAYSWRKIMVPLAEQGYHVVAPDQRGYGRTTGWDGDYDGDLMSFGIANIVRDALALVFALGYRSIDAVVGHDFGSPVAAYCALIRPDVFRSVVLMSAPFDGPPAFPEIVNQQSVGPDVYEELLTLESPRKHYQKYYSTRSANADMLHCSQGLKAFLRAYFHHKSADWEGNNPYPLKEWSAEEAAKMPTYYIMDRDKDMAETVAEFMPSDEQIATCSWLTEDELDFYEQEFSRTGFQGGLQWYRCRFTKEQFNELCLYAGMTIDVPSCFIGGEKDWGVYQQPGVFEGMQGIACTQMNICERVPDAGHWVQQEQPDEVVDLIKRFLTTQSL